MLKLIFTAVLFNLLSASAEPLNCSHFTVISHRGLSGLAPEESELAYLLAADLKTDYLEMDVHRTLDGVLIVTHDLTFERTTNIRAIFPNRARNPISSFTFEEISKLETGTSFNSNFPEFENDRFVGSKILRLKEVIELALAHPFLPGLYIETKNPDLYPGIENEIVNLLKSSNAFETLKIIFQSFDSSSLLRFKALVPSVPRIYLLDNQNYSDLIDTDLKEAIASDMGVGPNFEQIPIRNLQSFVSLAHDSKMLVHFYTLNSMSGLSQAITLGADGAFTNRTDLLQELCGRMTAHETSEIITNRLK